MGFAARDPRVLGFEFLNILLWDADAVRETSCGAGRVWVKIFRGPGMG